MVICMIKDKIQGLWLVVIYNRHGPQTAMVRRVSL